MTRMTTDPDHARTTSVLRVSPLSHPAHFHTNMEKQVNKNLKRGLIAALITVLLGGIFVMASGGPSKAAALITGADVKDQSLFSGDLGPESVGVSEVRNGSLTGGDMNPNTVKRFLAGERAQAENLNQDDKISSLEDRVEAEEAEGDTVGINTARAGAGYTNFADPGYSVKFAKCAPGKVAISGGYRLNGHASEAFSGADQNAMPEGLSVVATEPAGVVNGELVNTYQHPDFPQTAGGSFEGNAWAVTFKNDTANALPVRVWATCVNAS